MSTEMVGGLSGVKLVAMVQIAELKLKEQPEQHWVFRVCFFLSTLSLAIRAMMLAGYDPIKFF